MITKTVTSGTPIFAEGDAADCAYLIEEGWVEIYFERRGRRQVLARLGPGELFGELGVIDGSPRSASAAAVQECRLLVLTAEEIQVALARCEPFYNELLNRLVTRFRSSQKVLLEGGGPREESSGLGPGFEALAKVRDIADAIVKGEIEPFFQPIVDLTTGQLRGFEALARWRCARRGLVPPFEFLPLAERSGLIRKIDLAMADKAMAICRSLGAGEDGPFISLNFSAVHFQDHELIGQLDAMMSANDLPPSRVRLELAESLMLNDPDAALEIMTALKGLGVSMALDDFGTGFSSLSVLHRMPIDVVKVDRSFVSGIVVPGRPRIIFGAIAALTRELGMDLVAEGIEDQATVTALLEMGCTTGQGYLFSPPMSAEKAVTTWAAGPGAAARPVPAA